MFFPGAADVNACLSARTWELRRTGRALGIIAGLPEGDPVEPRLSDAERKIMLARFDQIVATVSGRFTAELRR